MKCKIIFIIIKLIEISITQLNRAKTAETMGFPFVLLEGNGIYSEKWDGECMNG